MYELVLMDKHAGLHVIPTDDIRKAHCGRKCSHPLCFDLLFYSPCCWVKIA